MEGGQTNEFRPLILVAEDDDSNFKLIKAIIGKKCDIQWAKNGEEIVALFKEYGNEAKAILMDIKMPVMNGLDATKIIRGENKDIPIIMQTAYAFSSDKENAMNAVDSAQYADEVFPRTGLVNRSLFLSGRLIFFVC